MQRLCIIELLLRYGVLEGPGGEGFDWGPLAAKAPGKPPDEVAQVRGQHDGGVVLSEAG